MRSLLNQLQDLANLGSHQRWAAYAATEYHLIK